MGEVQGSLFPLRFNRSVEVLPTSEKLTSDSGAVVLREIGERLGLWRLLERALVDFRDPDLITHPFIELVRTAILGPAHGWVRQRDVELLREDPALRLAVSNRRGDRPLRPAREDKREPEKLASQATLSRLMASLSAPENREALSQVMCSWAAHRKGLSPERRRGEVTLDLDSLPIDVHGRQVGSASNGYYRCRCFHPLVVSWESGDFLGAMLREGNVYTSTDALGFVLPYLRWADELAHRVWLRIDAGFPEEGFLSAIEAGESWRYVSRLKSNERLEAMAAPYVDKVIAKGARRTDRLHLVELGTYRASSAKKKWSRARRVVLVLDERPRELVPHWFFLVTNAPAQEASGEALLERYRKRGRAEKEYGEWQNALEVALSSTNRMKRSYLGELPKERSQPVDSFAVNEATLLLSLLTANLMYAGTELVRRAVGQSWSRQTFRHRILKTPGRIARSGRQVRLWIQDRYAEHWWQLGEALGKLPAARGSPRLSALPSA